MSRLRSLALQLASRQHLSPADAVVVSALVLGPTLAVRLVLRYYGLAPDGRFIDPAVMDQWIRFQSWIALPLVFGFGIAGLVARQVQPDNRFLAHACAQTIVIFVASYSYLLGHSTDLYGVLSLFLLLAVGTFLFDGAVMRGALITFLVVVIATTAAEQLRWIPYAPLYLRPPIEDGHLARSVLIQHGFSFLMLAVVAFFFLAMTQQLRVLQRAAEHADQAKSRFLAAASHDLRQPLHALGFLIEGLATRVPDGEARELVDRARTSTDELGHMFDSLLDLSKIEAGAIEPALTRFALDPLLERLVGEFEPLALDGGLRLQWTPTGVAVESDRVLLGRILQNLISNAIRHTGDGSVSVTGTRRDDFVEIEVADTGPGIPQERQHEIFQEFVQLGDAPREGLGLGLAIVERLAQLLHHDLVLRSEPGRGSTFRLRVPAAPASDTDARALPERLDPSRGLEGRLVLVIDDDLSILAALRTTLRQWGCEVLVASSVEDALLGLSHSGRVPDVVLADYTLAGDETGVEAIARIRAASDSEIPALVITGETRPEVARAIRAHSLRQLTKPAQPHRLRALLSELLRA